MPLAIAGVAPETPGDQGQQATELRIAETIELSRLLDLSAKQMNLAVEYDPSKLAERVTIRNIQDLSEAELWRLSNQLLAQRGWTTIRGPAPDVLNVVSLQDAAEHVSISSRAEFEQELSRPGFSAIRISAKHRPSTVLSKMLSPLLSNEGGKITVLGDSNHLIVADLTPRVNAILEVLEDIDVQEAEITFRKVQAEFIDATKLASLVKAAATGRQAADDRTVAGTVTPLPDGDAVVVFAPLGELPRWIELIELFDQREMVVTRTYQPVNFSVAEVADLVAETAKADPPRGSGDRWQVVENALTGTLIVTATRSEHDTIESLLDDLAAVPAQARRPMRIFTIRNRSVNDIVGVLERMMQSGGLADALMSERRPSEPGDSFRQQSLRQQVPPPVEVTPERAGRQSSPHPDEETAQRTDREHLPLELTVDEGTNTLIAIGNARLLEQLEEMIAQLDVRQPQVIIETLVISLSESDTLDLGVELRKLETSGETFISLASLFGLSEGDLEDGSVTTGGPGFSGVILNPGDFSVVIRALETLNDGRSLSIPRLLVNNNQTGVLNSVLQEPFVSTNASDTVATTSFAGTQDAGTTITITPQIAEGDHLVLEYDVALSNFVGDSASPAVPPPRQQNALSSVVTIPDGFTIVVGGLDVTSDRYAESRVPLLSSVPGLGELFKNRSNSRSRSRFFVFIRATVLRHKRFDDLKYISDDQLGEMALDDGWPEVKPRLIR